MRALARVGAHQVLSARALARAAGIMATRRACCGCRGQIDTGSMCVYLNARGHPWTQNHSLAHELLHLVLALADLRYPHDEHRVDWGATALLMPRARVLEVLRTASLEEPQALLAAFPLVPPARVLLRAAWVARRCVAVHIDRGRHVWAPEDQPMPEPSPAEASLVREVRYSLSIVPTLSGMLGVPVGKVGADGVLIVFPEHLDEGW